MKQKTKARAVKVSKPDKNSANAKKTQEAPSPKPLSGLLCLGCGEVLISRHRHDFVRCDCDNQSFIDGGQNDYIRWGGKDMSLMKHVEITEREIK